VPKAQQGFRFKYGIMQNSSFHPMKRKIPNQVSVSGFTPLENAVRLFKRTASVARGDFSQTGFTLIELLIVIAVGAILTTGSFLALSGFRDSQSLKLTTSEVMSVMRDTRQKSVSQENGKQWGIRFSNSTSSEGTYTVWNGADYDTGTTTQTRYLGRGTRFGNPSPGSNFDIVFSPISGSVSEKRVISLRSGSKNLVNDIIVDSLGRTTDRYTEGLVGYWHFDEGTSTVVYDATSNTNNGVLVNNLVWQSGNSCKAGGCLDFNGSNNYISASSSDSLNIDDSLTLTVWMNPDSWGSRSRGVFSKKINDASNGYVLYNDGTFPTKINFRMKGTNGTSNYLHSSSDVSTGVWQFWVVVYDASEQSTTLYKDGNEDATYSSIDIGDMTNSEGFHIGHSQTWNGYFDGKIDEVRIYNRALSAQEILDIYNDLR